MISKLNGIVKSQLITNVNKRLLSDEKKLNTESSVDDGEMERFQKWAQAWWIENGEYDALHRMNALRVPLIKDTLLNNRQVSDENLEFSEEDLICEPLLGMNILDVGCGGGILSEVSSFSFVDFLFNIFSNGLSNKK